MNSIKTIVWLFPVIFMLHDFEEIFFIEAWRKRYANQLQLAISKKKKVPYADIKDTPSFSIAVAIEFLIISLLSLFSCIFDGYLLWFGLFFGFTIHLIIHCVLSIQFRHFVPGVATSLPFLPVCIYLLYYSTRFFTFTGIELILYCLIGIVSVLLILLVLHKSMGTFEKWIRRFEKQS